MKLRILLVALATAGLWGWGSGAAAQTPPSASEIRAYTGLHAAVAAGDGAAVSRLIASGADLNARDGNGRTPAMVAAFMRDQRALTALAKAGADLNLLDHQAYDVITIASVLDDAEMVKLAVSLGASAKLITSPYHGTALIAAAHLGHDGVVRELIAAGAPLDHVNNLNWTALIESIVLGDGGPRHVATLQALMAAGADFNIPDGNGNRPLALAGMHGHARMVEILTRAGAKP
jgi:ankyrin repeat protein